MALFRPREWLGHVVKVNDLLPWFDEIVDRLAASEVPLDHAFGSDRHAEPPAVLSVGFGEAVEIERVRDVLLLLEGIPVERISVHPNVERRTIYVGGYGDDVFPAAVLTPELRDKIIRLELTTEALRRVIREGRTFRVVE